MVVVRKTESKLASANDSTEDLLIIPISETESLDGDANPVPRIIHQRGKNDAVIATTTFICTKSCGKRKRRQYQNFLDLLSKGPTDMLIPTIEDFLPAHQKSLLRLLEECTIFEAFCHGCEDLFDKCESISIQHNNMKRKWRMNKENDALAIMPYNSSVHSLSEKKALSRVEESILYAVICGSIPQNLVRDLESKLIQFFRNNPREIFMSRGFSSVERTALYAICNFHRLTYKCYRKRRYHIVQVRNANYNFEEPSLQLSNILLKCINSSNSEELKN